MSWPAVLVSVLLGFALAFNSATVPVLIVSTIIFSTLVFFIIRSFASFKQHPSRSIIQALILIVAVLIVLANISIRTMDCPLGVPFSTNVLTGECVVSRCGPPRVWYHTSGCALSDEQRMELLEREGWLDRPRESCMQRCETSPQLFCDPWLLRHEFHLPDLTCSDLVDCEIECPDMR